MKFQRLRAQLRGVSGDGPQVLYVPGIDGTGDLLLGSAERIAKQFRLTRVSYCTEDCESSGGSDYSDLAEGIQALCQEQGISRTLVLAESFGGAVALQLALNHPELVAGLMIVNSFAWFPSRAQIAITRLGAPFIPQAAFEMGRKWFAPKALFGSLGTPEALQEFCEIGGVVFDAGYLQRLHMIEELDLRPRLREIEAPVALFASDRDRVVPAVETMGVLESSLPDATLEIVQGGGHLILPLATQPWVQRLEDLAKRASF
ncbi:MAG: pimeloyl-ACP methyl ester carboxylesterase [Planctomycetota bacterium]